MTERERAEWTVDHDTAFELERMRLFGINWRAMFARWQHALAAKYWLRDRERGVA